MQCGRHSPEQWFKIFLDDIQEELTQIEALLTLLHSGQPIQDDQFFHTVDVARLLAKNLGLAIDPALTAGDIDVFSSQSSHRPMAS
jgi:hypothetical protein